MILSKIIIQHERRDKSKESDTNFIIGYRYQCNSIFKWLIRNNYGHYSVEGENRYLQNYCAKHGKGPYYTTLRTVIYRLNDILKHTWSDVHSDKGKHFYLPDAFVKIVHLYCHWNVRKEHATGTIGNKRSAVSWVLDELSKQKCKFLEEMSPILVTQMCIKITDHNLWGKIRMFLRYLLQFEDIKSDYSTIVPHYTKPYVIFYLKNRDAFQGHCKIKD